MIKWPTPLGCGGTWSASWIRAQETPTNVSEMARNLNRKAAPCMYLADVGPAAQISAERAVRLVGGGRRRGRRSVGQVPLGVHQKVVETRHEVRVVAVDLRVVGEQPPVGRRILRASSLTWIGPARTVERMGPVKRVQSSPLRTTMPG